MYMPTIGDRVLGKVDRYLTHIWAGVPIPTETSCSGIVIRQMHNTMFLVKADNDQLFACQRGYIYKPT